MFLSFSSFWKAVAINVIYSEGIKETLYTIHSKSITSNKVDSYGKVVVNMASLLDAICWKL
jgi:hypothetical protein